MRLASLRAGATPEFFRSRGLHAPPDFGPLAAVTPGTPGGLHGDAGRVRHDVLGRGAGAGDGDGGRLPNGADAKRVNIEANKDNHRAVGLVAPRAAAALRSEASRSSGPRRIRARFSASRSCSRRCKSSSRRSEALARGRTTRKEAILAAYDRFYRGDIGREVVAATQAAGGLFTMEDLDRWQVHVEDPAVTIYKGIEVYKLNHWVQGPAMLQTLNILENVDLKLDGLQQRALHSCAVSGDESRVRGSRFLLRRSRTCRRSSRSGACSRRSMRRERLGEINWHRNDPLLRPGDPYPFQGEANPYRELLDHWRPRLAEPHRGAANRCRG